MSLPGITTPGRAPPFQAAGHAIEQGDVYANVPMAAGYNRKRRVTTAQNRKVSVEWFLENAMMATVHDWFENALVVGTRLFAAPVANEGAGIQWWTAKWFAPFTEDPVNLGDRMTWRVSGVLLLSGEGEDTYSAASDLAIEIEVDLTGSAFIAGDSDLGIEIVASLEHVLALGIEIPISLLAASVAFSPRTGAVTITGLAPTATVSNISTGGETDILATQIFGG